MGLVFTIVVLKYLHAHHTVVVEITGTKKINSLSHKSPESIYVDYRLHSNQSQMVIHIIANQEHMGRSTTHTSNKIKNRRVFVFNFKSFYLLKLLSMGLYTY